jgi:hypothetical protein
MFVNLLREWLLCKNFLLYDRGQDSATYFKHVHALNVGVLGM